MTQDGSEAREPQTKADIRHRTRQTTRFVEPLSAILWVVVAGSRCAA